MNEEILMSINEIIAKRGVKIKAKEVINILLNEYEYILEIEEFDLEDYINDIISDIKDASKQ